MKHIFRSSVLMLTFLIMSPLLCFYKKINSTAYLQADTKWTLIGAGGAGIAVAGMLLEIGVDPQDIIWVDPDFNVGRLGNYYYNVPGNSIAKNYISFVNECSTFKNYTSPALEYLRNYYPYECCTLQIVIDALQDITSYLKSKIPHHTQRVTSLQFIQGNWLVSLSDDTSFSSHNVVLATGSHPKTLDYPCDYVIPLDDALDINRLTPHLKQNDTIALIGGSHSGMLVLKYLHELNVKRIINFYLHPITYAYDMGNNNVPDYNGLKGDVAEWVFNVLEGQQPENIMRVKNTTIARDAWLPVCNKIIYAIGFDRNPLPLIGNNTENLTYNDTTGEIMPQLFGFGIAFPEKIIDPWGKPQHTVGLSDFLTYAQRVVPEWVSTTKKRCFDLNRYDHLFNITLMTTHQLYNTSPQDVTISSHE